MAYNPDLIQTGQMGLSPRAFPNSNTDVSPVGGGINSRVETLANLLQTLHGAISELEGLLENNGFLSPAPSTTGIAGAQPIEKSRPRVSEQIRVNAVSVDAAISRIFTLRDRVEI
jgi:hypothetical protein